jgi:NACHT domain
VADKTGSTLDRGLAVASVVAAVIAVFQQSNGIRIGAGLTAAILLVALVVMARRRVHVPLSVNWIQRRMLSAYFEATVTDFLKELPELPLPAPVAAESLANRVSYKSAYVPVPYRAFPHRPNRAMPGREIVPRPGDPLNMLIGLLHKDQSALVLGDPGSGKTLLAMLTFAVLADRYRASRGRALLPVFLRLNEMESKGQSTSAAQSVSDLMPEALKSLGGSRLERLLDARRVCIILDGLDELPSTRGGRNGTASRMPDELVLLLRNLTIITCREAFHTLYVDTDKVANSLGTEVELLPLTYDGEVVPFTRQYCTSLGQASLAEVVLGILGQNAALAETLSRPLMLRMTIDVLAFELEHGDMRVAERMLLTGSDYLNADIYERYVKSWIIREHRKADDAQLSVPKKLDLVEAIAWQIFCNPVRTDTGYGSFELVDLTVDKATLVATIDDWIKANVDSTSPRFRRSRLVTEIEERTFLIVSERTDTYRFVHKSFFEYMVARRVYTMLATGREEVASLVSMLSLPFPDEIIDFIRELLHWSKTPEEVASRRRNVEQSLVGVLRTDDRSDSSLMARQQAANLLPIVATADTQEFLRGMVVSDDHPFIRRAVAVGEALHHQDSEFLDKFVATLDGDPRAASFHMGYNRIYYGDQPLSRTLFEDDGQPECSRFFRACVRHLQLERYRYIRTMALATIRLMLQDPLRRALLIEKEANALRVVMDICRRPDPVLGSVYEHERARLLACISQALSEAGLDGEGEVSRPLDRGLEITQDRMRDTGAPGNKEVGDVV